MWRPDSGHEPTSLLRLCRDGLEWWVSDKSVLTRRDVRTFDGVFDSDLRLLERAIESLLEARGTELKGCRFDVVIESAWLPIIAIDTRRQLLSQVELDALLKHRIEQTYGDGSVSAQVWETRLMHRPGDDLAIGFALDPRLKELIVDRFASGEVRVLSIQPAYAWGWEVSVPDRRKACLASADKSVWWLWEESDRTLVSLADRKQVRALNVAAALLGQQDARVLPKREALRHGLMPCDAAALVGSWERSPVHRRHPRPAVDFLRTPGQPMIGWLLLLLGLAAAGGMLSLQAYRDAVRAQENQRIEARVAAERREREASLRPAVPTIEEKRLLHIQPELDQPWLPLMRAIESVSEPPVFVLGLSMDPVNGKFQLDAEAPTFDEATGYVQSLAGIDLLKSVQIVMHENAVDPWGHPSVKFTVVARWGGV